ncbi:MAG TPA: DUF4390 domain-containing protein [Rhodocyclaceae bacterium]|nr:DUF4390 domain-containing protein [Rhodocyclaceae bacterium]
MAFITACCRKLLDQGRCGLFFGLLFVAAFAGAAEIEVSDPRFSAGEDSYQVSADFAIDFNPRLEEAVNRGVVLYFLVEFELTRPRWYWFDDKVVSRSQVIRLSYHALTRQYRVSTATGGLHQSYATLSEALRVLSRLRNWNVLDKSSEKTPKPGEVLQGALRLRLDITQLPKPFQISALGSRDWNLASEWKTWAITVPAGESQ